MVQAVRTKAVLQRAKAYAMCMACLQYARLPSPIPLPFFASAKPIFKRGNMQPKSDDTKQRHRWLKGVKLLDYFVHFQPNYTSLQNVKDKVALSNDSHCRMVSQP